MPSPTRATSPLRGAASALVLLAVCVASSGCDAGDAPSPALEPVASSSPFLDSALSASTELTATAIVGQPVADAPTPKEHPVPDPVDVMPTALIAHEWGTFVSVQTPEGEMLEGLHHEEEGLPPFVHSRCSGVPWCEAWNSKQIDILPEPATQKLETPVVYLYSPEPVDVRVSVSFPKGIISQWFPDAETMSPPLGHGLDQLAEGAMTWDVTVNPSLDVDAAPWVPADDIWAPSRDVAATPLEVDGEVESFIFYRGLGRFEMPVRVSNDGTLATVVNDGDAELPSAWLLNVRDGKAGIITLGPIATGAPTVAGIPEANMPMETFVTAAKSKVQVGLEEDGLYSDEARAMVDTWERSYFQTEGLRLLYVVPRAWTDELLPIEIDPAPAELVRTLVGRVEALIQPEIEDAIALVDAWQKHPYDGSLLEQDRFIEPRLRAACDQLAADEDPRLWACEQAVAWVYGKDL